MDASLQSRGALGIVEKSAPKEVSLEIKDI
jgi:hypothetical protein